MRLPQVSVRVDDDVVVADVHSGDIDIASAAELGDMLIEAVPNHARGLVLRLEAVDYIDSAGVRMLFGLARRLSTSRQGLAMCLPESSPLQRLIKITNLGEVALIGADVRACADGIRTAEA